MSWNNDEKITLSSISLFITHSSIYLFITEFPAPFTMPLIQKFFFNFYSTYLAELDSCDISGRWCWKSQTGVGCHMTRWSDICWQVLSYQEMDHFLPGGVVTTANTSYPWCYVSGLLGISHIAVCCIHRAVVMWLPYRSVSHHQSPNEIHRQAAVSVCYNADDDIEKYQQRLLMMSESLINNYNHVILKRILA